MTLEVGVKVKILTNAGYRDKYVGELGIVERNNQFSGGTIGVRLDNYTNKSSGYGIFWFEKSKLEVIERKDEIIMFENFKVAGISFLEGTNTNAVYAYALYDDTITVGDIVVVQSGHHGLGIAKVVDIDASGENTKAVQCGREIIAKVDFSAYEERKEKAKKMKNLKRQMDAKVQELQHQAIYELLAEKDPSLKAMLDEYKNLMK